MDKSGGNSWESVSNGLVVGNADEERLGSLRTISYDPIDETEISGPFTRRPLSGISIRNDTPAYVQVLGPNGSPRRVFNDLGSVMSNPGLKDEFEADGQPHSKYWTDWILTTVQESRQE